MWLTIDSSPEEPGCQESGQATSHHLSKGGLPDKTRQFPEGRKAGPPSDPCPPARAAGRSCVTDKPGGGACGSWLSLPLQTPKLPVLRTSHPTAPLSHARNRQNRFGLAWSRAVYNYPHSALPSPPSQGGGSGLRSPRHGHQPPRPPYEGREPCQECTDGPVGPEPGGPQGNISASLLPSSVPWALPGAQKHVTRHNPHTRSLRGSSEGNADGVTPT